MKFTYTVNENLPPLAWIAQCTNGNIDVICGKYVETADDCFVSGAWNGNFEDKLFEQAEWFCGTGGKIINNNVVFSTPTHVTEGLFLAEGSNKTVISNSLSFLLSFLDYHLDVNYLNYEIDFNTIIQGIHKYKKEIYVLDKENNATAVKVFYYRNIIIDQQNQWQEVVKPYVKPFTCFSDYSSRLFETMKQLKENACDSKRHKSYGIVTTISKGYDAPTCSVIAKKIGCNTAVTFKAEGKYAEDSGVEIAKHLNFKNIIERDASKYKSNQNFTEAHYICTGELGASISFSAFDEDFKDNLVFTGDRGDSIWNANAKNNNNEFHFIAGLNHFGLSENHLWLGFITVPMPLFGATAWESIYDISNSDEMTPWRLNNDYDRPIPRRICEEAGIKRNDFGMQKRGAGFIYRYDSLKRIKNRMSNTSASSFERFVKKYGRMNIVLTISYFYKLRNLYISYILSTLRLNKLGIKLTPPSLNLLSQTANPLAPRYLIPWASSVMIEKYKNILGR